MENKCIEIYVIYNLIVGRSLHMRMTESKLRRIIRQVILENSDVPVESEDKLNALAELDGIREIVYDGCGADWDQVCCGFIVDGKEIEFNATFPKNADAVLESFLYKLADYSKNRFSLSYEDLEDGILISKLKEKLKKTNGQDILDVIDSDVLRANEKANNYMPNEFGDDDEFNPY